MEAAAYPLLQLTMLEITVHEVLDVVLPVHCPDVKYSCFFYATCTYMYVLNQIQDGDPMFSKK